MFNHGRLVAGHETLKGDRIGENAAVANRILFERRKGLVARAEEPLIVKSHGVVRIDQGEPVDINWTEHVDALKIEIGYGVLHEDLAAGCSAKADGRSVYIKTRQPRIQLCPPYHAAVVE